MGLAVLGVGLSSASADLFGFTISNTVTSFSGSTLTTTDAISGSTFHLYRNDLGQAVNMYSGADNFSMTMAISDITASTALGTGNFSFQDRTGETITGMATGTWVLQGDNSAKFTGALSNVYYNGSDNGFDGWVMVGDNPPVATPGAVSMLNLSEEPWSGGITEITVANVWFNAEWRATPGGSIDAVVTPVPAALLIGLLGLGTAGLKLRRFA